jgi:hypothetical protein
MGAHSATVAGRNRRSTTAKIVASAAVVGGAATLLSGGIYAAWQTGGSHTQSLGTADVSGAFTDVGTNKFTVGVSQMLPGDYVNRYTTLANTGDVDQTFALSLLGNGNLTADTDGLKASVTECTVAWVDGVCGGTETDVITEGFLTDAGTSTNFTLAASASKHLRIYFLLPDTADQATFQNQDDAIDVTATGTAVGGGADRSAG